MPLSVSELPNARAWVEIDLGALEANVRALSRWLSPGRALMAVVKADAYGHGLVPVTRAALRAGASWLGVATVAEGMMLRGVGVTDPIALLCAPAPGEARDLVKCQLTPLVGDAELCSALSVAAGAAGLEVHLDLDTGIGRAGALPEDAVALWKRCMQQGLKVTGFSTHFADADSPTTEITQLQWKRFLDARRALEEAGAQFEWMHASNSAAVLRYGPHMCNLARPGLLLYGLHPVFPEGSLEAEAEMSFASVEVFSGENVSALPDVQPVLALKARIGSVRDLPAGHTISYGATCRLQRRSRVATVLIGYGDGYPRRLSNTGEILLKGRRAPILGRVCMDQTVIDVTDLPDVQAGDIAVCIGADGADAISAEEIARKIQTTEHEITTCLTARLPRIYLN